MSVRGLKALGERSGRSLLMTSQTKLGEDPSSSGQDQPSCQVNAGQFKAGGDVIFVGCDSHLSSALDVEAQVDCSVSHPGIRHRIECPSPEPFSNPGYEDGCCAGAPGSISLPFIGIGNPVILWERPGSISLPASSLEAKNPFGSSKPGIAETPSPLLNEPCLLQLKDRISSQA